MNNVRVCDECRGVCVLLRPTRQEFSEWYCEPCHKSYPVDGLSKPRVLERQ